jgi:hypothetical protein
MKAVIGMAIGMLVCAGCAQTAQQQSAQQCFLVESAVCATTNDPMSNRPGFGACLANGATLCGVVHASAPVAVPPTKLSRNRADAAGA